MMLTQASFGADLVRRTAEALVRDPRGSLRWISGVLAQGSELTVDAARHHLERAVPRTDARSDTLTAVRLTLPRPAP